MVGLIQGKSVFGEGVFQSFAVASLVDIKTT